MCNAMNHPAGCTCGWGWGHQGPRGKPHSSYWPPGVTMFNVGRASSYTVPNARCPVCNAEVFYYCNEAGSSVFFDELGPPWPKHPCTTREHTPLPRYASAASCHEDRKIPDSLTVINSIFIHDFTPDLLKITFECSDQGIPKKLYCAKKTIRDNLPKVVVAYISPRGEDSFAIDYLGVNVKTYSIGVYVTQDAARSGGLNQNKQIIHISSKKIIPDKNRYSNERKVRGRIINSAIAEAFKRARNGNYN
jgi:hypothetical protein